MEQGQKLLKEGMFLIESGRGAKATPKLEKALAIFLPLENQERIALCRSYLGIVYRSERRFEEALEQFQEVLKLTDDLKDMFGVAQAYLDIGLTLSLQQMLDPALDYLNKSLQIVQEELKDKDLEVITLINIAGLHLVKGDLEAAAASYKIALEIAEKNDFIEGSAEGYKGLAEINEKKGDLEHAEKLYQKSLGLFRTIPDPIQESNILLRLGVLYSQLYQFKEAIFYFKQALKIKRRLNDKVGAYLCEKSLKTIADQIKLKNIKQ